MGVIPETHLIYMSYNLYNLYELHFLFRVIHMIQNLYRKVKNKIRVILIFQLSLTCITFSP